MEIVRLGEVPKKAKTYIKGRYCQNCEKQFEQTIPYGTPAVSTDPLCPHCGVSIAMIEKAMMEAKEKKGAAAEWHATMTSPMAGGT
ncbi:MAG: hypothetical protein E6R03_04055 [Hyphomicrobiaceae bacterium]|nr:MAG: hypothetical protein E6R03_04055 [Hyphomicrobiaceae bacterium]